MTKDQVAAGSGRVHIVDDEEVIRDALTWLLQSRGVQVSAWESAEHFLADYSPLMRGCILVDVRMDGMSGLELFDRLQNLGCRMPTIFLTGHANVPLAVAALKKGARDFVEKPFSDNDLVDRIIDALAFDDAQREKEAGSESITSRLATLTHRERQVMDLVVTGKLNKIIADELGVSMRTVEVHRARVFEKMGVKTAVELTRLLSQNR